MLYVEQSLGPDEELVHIGNFHWFYTLQAFMAIFWGVVASIAVLGISVFAYIVFDQFPPNISYIQGAAHIHPGLRICAFVAFVLGLLSFAQMMVIKATTEIAITNTRLVYKRGLIARNVGEISIDRIEGVNVLQSIMGRFFNFGRLAIRGMGIGEVLLPPIEDPIAFRKAIEQAKSI